MPVSIRLMSAAAWALLNTAPAGLTRYQSVVDPTPPVDPQTGITKAYAVFHPFGGDDTPGNLARLPDGVLWQCQITCAGGNHDYVLWAVDTVRGLFTGKTLAVAGHSVGVMTPPFGYQPPAPMPQPVDAGAQRLQVPLLYQVRAAA